MNEIIKQASEHGLVENHKLPADIRELMWTSVIMHEHCPCVPIFKRSEDTICVCKNARDNGECKCKLFINVEEVEADDKED